MKRSRFERVILFAALAALFSVIFALVADGQTPRRRSTPKPKPLATPPTVLTGAEIISQAGDYDQPQQPASEPVTTPAEKPANVNAARIRELNERVKKLEGGQGSDYDAKQKRMLLNLDILTRAEGRSEALRKQLFDMMDRENTIKTRLDQIEIDLRPESIERALILAGSLRPEEIRDARRKSLEAERSNLESLLTNVQANRTSLAENVQKADAMVEKLRAKLEKDIDESFLKDEDQ